MLDTAINPVQEKSEQTETLTSYTEFEVLTTEIMNSISFWVTPCSLVEFYPCFRRMYYLLLQGQWVSQANNQKEASKLVTWINLK
jgi:hypothetical protein